MLFAKNGITAVIPRRLSRNEQRMADLACDTIARLSHNTDVQMFMMQYAIKPIICPELVWPSVAESLMRSLSKEVTANGRRNIRLAVMSTIIGMVHVYEVRYNEHNGARLAHYIDAATRPLGYDAMPGIIDENMAYNVINRVYAKRHAEQSTAFDNSHTL